MTSDAPIQTLLVDTNSGDARRVSQALAHAPFAYELTHVVSLTDALDSTRERSHDVVLFDLGESEEAGIESFVTLIESAPATPVVVFTGQGDDVSGLRALELGAQDYLTKPLTDIYSLHRSASCSQAHAKTARSPGRNEFAKRSTVLSFLSLSKRVALLPASAWHSERKSRPT